MGYHKDFLREMVTALRSACSDMNFEFWATCMHCYYKAVSFYETLFPQPSRKHGIKDITLSLARLYTCCIYINFCLLCTYGDTKFVNGDHGDQFSWDIWSRRITSGRVNSCVFSHSCTNCPGQKDVWQHVTQPLILRVSHSSTAYCVLYSTHGCHVYMLALQL